MYLFIPCLYFSLFMNTSILSVSAFLSPLLLMSIHSLSLFSFFEILTYLKGNISLNFRSLRNICINSSYKTKMKPSMKFLKKDLISHIPRPQWNSWNKSRIKFYIFETCLLQPSLRCQMAQPNLNWKQGIHWCRHDKWATRRNRRCQQMGSGFEGLNL